MNQAPILLSFEGFSDEVLRHMEADLQEVADDRSLPTPTNPERLTRWLVAAYKAGAHRTLDTVAQRLETADNVTSIPTPNYN